MTVDTMWDAYIKSIGESVITTEKTYESWHFCNNEMDANKLAELTKHGIKRATASLKKSYDVEKEPIPKERSLHIITYFDGSAACIIETTKVEMIPFNKITEEHAKVEGEGDGSLTYWREGHMKFFKEEAKTFHFEFSENDLVVFMTFKVIHQ